jgi:hypothetical protein
MAPFVLYREEEVPLQSLGVRLPVAALYHKVRLRPGGH